MCIYISFLISFQTSEGTPNVTGWFEVLVDGEPVHSKKVYLSPLPTWISVTILLTNLS
jgi:hypothetical protein